MPYLPYRQPRDHICKFGNPHPYGFLCNQCREDARIREQKRLEKQAEENIDSNPAPIVEGESIDSNPTPTLNICPKCSKRALFFLEKYTTTYECLYCKSTFTIEQITIIKRTERSEPENKEQLDEPT